MYTDVVVVAATAATAAADTVVKQSLSTDC